MPLRCLSSACVDACLQRPPPSLPPNLFPLHPYKPSMLYKGVTRSRTVPYPSYLLLPFIFAPRRRITLINRISLHLHVLFTPSLPSLATRHSRQTLLLITNLSNSCRVCTATRFIALPSLPSPRLDLPPQSCVLSGAIRVT